MALRMQVHTLANLEPRDDHWAVRVSGLPMIVYGDTPELALGRAQFATGVFLRAYNREVGPSAVRAYLNGRSVSCVIEEEGNGQNSVVPFEALVNAYCRIQSASSLYS